MRGNNLTLGESFLEIDAGRKKRLGEKSTKGSPLRLLAFKGGGPLV